MSDMEQIARRAVAWGAGVQAWASACVSNQTDSETRPQCVDHEEVPLGIYEDIAKSHPKLQEGKVWCRTCKKEQEVDTVHCLKNGWPKCCGLTMSLDKPEKR
jgi:hypothetical protein